MGALAQKITVAGAKPCGCGGAAVLVSGLDGFRVECERCGTGTGWCAAPVPGLGGDAAAMQRAVAEWAAAHP